MILAVETSCDETALALFSDRMEAELVASQVLVHEPFDGVVPELAAREHLKCLPRLLEQLVSQSGIPLSSVTLVAVTRGPGLKGCLLVGNVFAHSLALALDVPCCGINHLEGHVFAPMLDNRELHFPFLTVLVSGGHSEIVLVQGLGNYQVLSKTIDDAAGEAFDKAASMLGLPYPGGPRLARLADSVEDAPFALPLVMRERPEMSFSGLKTAARTLVLKHALSEPIATECIRTEFGYLTPQLQRELAYAVQRGIIDALMLKIERAVQATGVRQITLTGGVAANQALRRAVAGIAGVRLFVPEIKHCTDNAAMIAHVAYLRREAGLLSITGEASVLSRWPLESMNSI